MVELAQLEQWIRSYGAQISIARSLVNSELAFLTSDEVASTEDGGKVDELHQTLQDLQKLFDNGYGARLFSDVCSEGFDRQAFIENHNAIMVKVRQYGGSESKQDIPFRAECWTKFKATCDYMDERLALILTRGVSVVPPSRIGIENYDETDGEKETGGSGMFSGWPNNSAAQTDFGDTSTREKTLAPTSMALPTTSFTGTGPVIPTTLDQVQLGQQLQHLLSPRTTHTPPSQHATG